MKKIIDWFNGLGSVTYLLFILGMFISAIFALPLCMKFCIWPALFAAFIVEFVSMWRKGKWNTWRFVTILLGALPIQILVVL